MHSKSAVMTLAVNDESSSEKNLNTRNYFKNLSGKQSELSSSLCWLLMTNVKVITIQPRKRGEHWNDDAIKCSTNNIKSRTWHCCRRQLDAVHWRRSPAADPAPPEEAMEYQKEVPAVQRWNRSMPRPPPSPPTTPSAPEMALGRRRRLLVLRIHPSSFHSQQSIK